MKDFPNSFWAAIFIAMAVLLAITAMYSGHADIAKDMLELSMSIVTGAFGYIQGVKDGANQVNNPKNSTIIQTEPPKENP